VSNVLSAEAVFINVSGVLGNELSVLEHGLVNRIY